MQTPPEHWSFWVHGLLSLQLVPSALACAQPVVGLQLSVVQGFLSSQLGGGVPPHFPQLLMSAIGVWTHPPLVHESVVQSLPSSHETHAAPPVPHAVVTVLPGWHVVPSQQPVQQAPSSHLPAPLMQLVPAATFCVAQLPLTQLSVTHSLLWAQLTQAAPALPHAVVSVPSEQPVPVQQPWQQLPPKQSPPVHAVRSVAADDEHSPDVHAATWQSPAVHAWQ